MNRVFSPAQPTRPSQDKTPRRSPRPTQGLQDDTQAMLRDIAYVLSLTRRVRESILQEHMCEAGVEV